MSQRIARSVRLAVLMGLAATAHGGGRVADIDRHRRGSTRTGSRRSPTRRPILADHPEFVEPVREVARFEAPVLVDDPGADLDVRAWRFSYNARGIIEMPNRLRADRTAVIVVHPWGIDDGQGWKTPEPNGVCDFCTPAKNQLAARHTREVINPFLKSLRGKVGLVMYSLPGTEDPIRKKLYRSFRGQPDRRRSASRAERELKAKLAVLPLQGRAAPGDADALGRDADDRLLPPVPRPRRRAALQRPGVLGRCRSR